MKRLAVAKGYTIVEVMLFLVITGVLLSSAIFVFSGRQRRTEFTQGVREFDTELRTIINEAASGYYPNKGDVKCTSSGGSGPQLSKTANSQQGGNSGCTYLGRVLQFTTGEDYFAYTVVGQQKGANGKEVTRLGSGQDDARQTLITPTDSQDDLPDATSSYKMPNGITVSKVSPPVSGFESIGALGFITSLGTLAENGNDLVSGSSNLNLIPLLNTSLDSTKTDIVNSTKAMGSYEVNPGKIVICLRSGGGDRKAAVVVGYNNNNTGTEIFIDDVPSECQDA